MTREEIIKAYEDKVNLIASMTSVYLDEEDGLDLYSVMSNARDLINCQKAEVERLNSDITSLNNTIQNLLITVSKTKKSTIEEFIEKLEAKLQKRALFSVIDTIHEVAAEMAGDTE